MSIFTQDFLSKILIWTIIAFIFIIVVKGLEINLKKQKKKPKRKKKKTSLSAKEKERLIVQKGKEGELATRKILESLPFDTVVFGDVYLPKKQGMEQTQIDLICITPKTIFVIENKNYSGKVYFDRAKDTKDWTYYVGKNKYDFYSPEKQNNIHINAVVSNFPDITRDKIVSLIVFGDKADLSNVQKCKQHIVINQHELETTIKDIHKQIVTSFTKKQMKYFASLLSPFVDGSEKRRIQHSKNFTTTK